MPTTIQHIIHPGATSDTPDFPDAPPEWSPAIAEERARELGLEMNEDIEEAIRVLQGAYRDEPEPPLRRLHDALDGRFASQGGIRHLYAVFGRGPITAGCYLAGLRPPAGAVDQGFGSVA